MIVINYKTILFETINSVAKITFNRPDKFNSFTETMHKELIDILKEIDRNHQIRCVVITGAGRAFHAGQDLDEVMGTQVDFGEFLRKRYHPLIEQLQKMEKPIIAAVNGVAAGAGMSLALACDIRLVSEKSTFVNAFINIGLIPDSGGCYFLPRIVGIGKALELAMTGERISAEEAFRLGLANQMYAVEDFEKEVMNYAERMANLPTKGIGLIKRVMREGLTMGLEETLEHEAHAQEIAGSSQDHQEGLQAFMEKRKPIFRGN